MFVSTPAHIRASVGRRRLKRVVNEARYHSYLKIISKKKPEGQRCQTLNAADNTTHTLSSSFRTFQAHFGRIFFIRLKTFTPFISLVDRSRNQCRLSPLFSFLFNARSRRRAFITQTSRYPFHLSDLVANREQVASVAAPKILITALRGQRDQDPARPSRHERAREARSRPNL